MASWEYKPYQESDELQKLRQQYQSYQQQKPADYTNQYQSQIQSLQNQIANRPAFRYDVNGDALYQQMAQRYMQQGRQAMMDTMGQAAGLTGGYGSSYGQAVGQQQYNAYLQGIADNLPNYYNMALNAYTQQGQDMYNQLNMYQTAENQDYSRWNDQYSRYNTELARLESSYNTERNWDRSLYDSDRSYDRSVYENDRAFDYNVQQNNRSLAQEQVNWYLSIGQIPPDDLINMSGLSRDYINAVVEQQKLAAAAAEASYYSAPASSNAGSDVTYGAQNIIELGRGPISAGTVDSLIASGDLNQIGTDKVGNTVVANAPGSTRTTSSSSKTSSNNGSNASVSITKGVTNTPLTGLNSTWQKLLGK